MNALQIRCVCGRNLADVTAAKHNPDWTRDDLRVTARPSVRHRSYRAADSANRRQVPLDERRGDAGDWHARTYTWHCRCGMTHTLRHEQVSAAWEQSRGRSDRRVYVTLGIDL